jgi:hypothetical protein
VTSSSEKSGLASWIACFQQERKKMPEHAALTEISPSVVDRQVQSPIAEKARSIWPKLGRPQDLAMEFLCCAEDSPPIKSFPH